MSDLPVRIFVSYSHTDADYLGERSLLGFVRGLAREENAEFWDDRRIAAGNHWNDEIQAKIAQSDIALVLISQSFLDSEYCTRVEITAFLERRRQQGLIIFPVILSPCEWERYPWLRSTQFWPRNGQTIEEHYLEPGARKRLFLEIRTDLREQIEKVRHARLLPVSPRASAAKLIFGERRRVTVLQCDLTGSDGARVDPEEILQVLTQYRSMATEVVRQFDGDAAQWQGRRLLAYFGNPKVHEDDAIRAVLAAREILMLPKKFDDSGEPSALATKVAIHTGSVIVTFAPETAMPSVVGDVAEVAAAVLALTPPNHVYLTAATEELIDKDYACSEVGTVELKDRGRALQLFALDSDKAEEVNVRSPARKAFVGRDHDLEMLRQRWELARECDGQVVCIRGEAGIGKSRLVQELRMELASDPRMLWLECRCSEYHQNTELYPLIDLLQRALSFTNRGQQLSPEQALEDIVHRAGMPLETSMPPLSSLLSLPLAPQYEPMKLSAEARKKKILAVMLDLILKLAERQPVMMIIEDLHWIDASTLGFVRSLIANQPTARLLTVLTYRLEFDWPWEQLSYLSTLTLTRLVSKETGALVSALTDGKALPPDVVSQIVEKSDGNPLFAEELTKMVTESDVIETAQGRYRVVRGGTLAIPSTLKGSLGARLDHLGTAKEIAQVASVIGREFFVELLSGVVDADEAELAKDLETLMQSEIILRRGLPVHQVYCFKHALIQQAAYESVLKRDVRKFHGKIAQVLVSQFPELAERQPEVVALHFESAEVPEKAIEYWHRAAKRSIRNSANIEAIAHLKRGLKLLDSMAEGMKRDDFELQLRTDLALPLIATKGYSAVEVDEELSRAKQLCTKVGDDAEFFRVVRLHWPFLSMRGAHCAALDATEQLRAMAEKHNAPQLRLEAYRATASTLFYMARLGVAREHFEQAMSLYDMERDRANTAIYGQDPGVSCLANLAPTLWFLGCHDQALATVEKALTLAREVAHPYSLCFALLFCSWPAVFGRDLDTLQRRMEEMTGIAQTQSFALWETIGTILFGWIRTQRDDADSGLNTMNEGLKRWAKLGARVFVPTFRLLMADVLAAAGKAEAALAEAEAGLQVCSETGEALNQDELRRLHAKLIRSIHKFPFPQRS
jgi:class 3 adenylate cyclase/predicted ATPase